VEAAGFATVEQQAALDAWPEWLPSGIVNLGLDLRGGAHLLAEVQVSDVYKAAHGWLVAGGARRPARGARSGWQRAAAAFGSAL
jgi:hypothetical protein